LVRRNKRDKMDTPWSNISDVLPSLLNTIVKTKRSRPKNIDSIWRSVIDPQYIKYTKVEKIQGDTLYVKVSSGAIFSELAMIGSEEILKKMKQHGKFPQLTRVVYRR